MSNIIVRNSDDSVNSQLHLFTNLERLQALETEARSTVAKLASILIEIHDNKLYLETHVSWEAYLKEKWNISRQYYYKLTGPTAPNIQRRQPELAQITMTLSNLPNLTTENSSDPMKPPKSKPVLVSKLLPLFTDIESLIVYLNNLSLEVRKPLMQDVIKRTGPYNFSKS